ncbi:MAG TPA: thioesterase family protein [Solirubrobacteraceae bacterium]|jgi:acyl-CoA thioester hydrolase
MTPLEVRTRIEVRWRDLDMLGHLNQSVYHELLEEGRGAFFQAVEMLTATVLARVELDYKLEVRREHSPVEVVVRLARFGRSSVTLAHEIVRADGEVASAGSSVHVAWDTAARRSRPLTAEERERLDAALGAATAG